MNIQDLPLVNASLNGTSAVLIILGMLAIKMGQREWHRKLMLGAIGVSACFLSCYLYYHFNVGTVTRFTHGGMARNVYYFILLTHIPLAILLLPLLALTVVPAMKGDFEKHKRYSKIAMPVWMYVSVTGVLVYLMLYVWYKPSAV
jgi:uncharacterized membrane protein YozB (DUF420 family)